MRQCGLSPLGELGITRERARPLRTDVRKVSASREKCSAPVVSLSSLRVLFIGRREYSARRTKLRSVPRPGSARIREERQVESVTYRNARAILLDARRRRREYNTPRTAECININGGTKGVLSVRPEGWEEQTVNCRDLFVRDRNRPLIELFPKDEIAIVSLTVNTARRVLSKILEDSRNFNGN